MTVAIVKKREWTDKGVDIFERNVIPPLLEHEGVEPIEYNTTDTYQTPEHHWFLGYLGRYKRGRQIVKAIRNGGHEKVFLPFQELLTFDPSTLDSQIIPYVHDVIPATTTFAGPIPTFLARRYVRNLIECELVLCASEQTKADIMNRTAFNAQAEVIYQGVEPRGPIEGLDPKYDLMYVGSLHERKNPTFLRKCIEQATDYGFECIAVLNENADGTDVPCEVRNGVTDETLQELYASSRYYLHPSKQEGFGRPPIEAQSAGTPAIALNTPINREILGRNGDGWLQVANPQDVLEVLQETSPAEYARLRDAAIVNAERFDWESTCDAICNYLFDKVTE